MKIISKIRHASAGFSGNVREVPETSGLSGKNDNTSNHSLLICPGFRIFT
ncbi:MAG: hypothetical protein LIP06_07905 [Tannerellaceae bacterium]|nr:hypothetical protein [Tannerellaceae bacterium]